MVESRYIPPACAENSLRLFTCCGLVEIGTGGSFFDDVTKTYDLSVNTDLGQPFLGLERSEPASVPEPDRDFFPCPSASLGVTQCVLKKYQRFALTREDCRVAEVVELRSQPFDKPRSVRDGFFAGDVRLHQRQRERRLMEQDDNRQTDHAEGGQHEIGAAELQHYVLRRKKR